MIVECLVDDEKINLILSKKDLTTQKNFKNKILYEDSLYLIDIKRLRFFLSTFKKIKPSELLSSGDESDFFVLKMPLLPPKKSFKAITQFNSDSFISYRNSASDLAIPFFLKNIYEKNLKLKPFQKDGIDWLKNGNSKILADDMGLGKTIQALSASSELMISGEIGKILVICPSSLTTNWCQEINKWLPFFSATQISNTGKKKNEIWKTLIHFSHFLVTNYEQLRILPKAFIEDEIDLIIADEAHKMRKGDSKIFNSIKKIKYKKFWALSGTPIEKNQSDIAHILKLIDPSKINLPVLSKLDNLSIRATARKYLLRRMKTDVLNDLKGFERTLHEIELNPNQKKSYDEVLSRAKKIRINDGLKIFSELKAICDVDPFTKESSKSDLVMELSEKIKFREEKCVIFSFWLEPLYELQKRIIKTYGSDSCVVFDGSLNKEERNFALNKFKSLDKCFIFLCSGKIGGEGINLTEANHAIFYNKWWNPSNNDQARDRVNRIGQKKKSFIHDLVTTNTIEYRINDILSNKKEITNEVITKLIKLEIAKE